MITPMQIGVYKLKYDSNTGYHLEYDRPYFQVIGKNYGKIDKHLSIVWNRFSTHNFNCGVLLTGAPGSGKTRFAEQLANLGIDAGMCTVLITDVKINIELIPFIDSLCNMTIMFDEFSKNVSLDLQNKMLTMFSSICEYKKKLFVLTENSRESISPYLRTRPGRIRYALDYDRISEDVILEYCKDNKISNSFVESILELYSKAVKFTFDHLDSLVSEHISYPDMPVEELLEMLNLDDLINDSKYRVIRVLELSTKITWNTTSSEKITKSGLGRRYFSYWVDVNRENPYKDKDGAMPLINKSFKITKDSFVRIEDGNYVYAAEGFEVYFSNQ